MRYRFDPRGCRGLVVDAGAASVTWDDGRTVDMVGGEFADAEGYRYRFREVGPGLGVLEMWGRFRSWRMGVGGRREAVEWYGPKFAARAEAEGT
jgi:hypothetical protein